MNKRGEVIGTAVIVISLGLLWLTQWYHTNSDRIDAIYQSREFCLEQAYSLPIAWDEDLGQCLLVDRADDKLVSSQENN